MSFQSGILRPLDTIRAIGGTLGLRVFTVTVRQRVWTGLPGEPGSTKTDTDTVLTNQAADGTKVNVLVRQVSRREAIASGGRFTDRDLKVGPITPPYPAAFQLASGGFDDGTVDPQPTNSAIEMLWIVASTNGTFGFPPSGALCEKVGEEATALHTYVFLRATGRLA